MLKLGIEEGISRLLRFLFKIWITIQIVYNKDYVDFTKKILILN